MIEWCNIHQDTNQCCLRLIYTTKTASIDFQVKLNQQQKITLSDNTYKQTTRKLKKNKQERKQTNKCKLKPRKVVCHLGYKNLIEIKNAHALHHQNF